MNGTGPLRAHRGEPFAKFDGAPEGRSNGPRWLIKGFVAAGSLTLLYGPPKAGKSALAGDMAAHVALGLAWHGRRVRRAGVVYLACERPALVADRLAAFASHHGRPSMPVDIRRAVPDLTTTADGERLAATLADAADRLGEPIGLVVIDTISRVLAGADENSPAVMGSLIRTLARHVPPDVAVLAIHHSPHDASRPRGHSALLAAADAAIRVYPGDGERPRTATVTDANDDSAGNRLAFRFEPVQLATDDDGEPVTAPVVVAVESDAPRMARSRRELAGNRAVAFDVLLKLTRDAPSVRKDAWRSALADTFGERLSGESLRRTINRLMGELIGDGIVVDHAGIIRAVGRSGSGAGQRDTP